MGWATLLAMHVQTGLVQGSIGWWARQTTMTLGQMIKMWLVEDGICSFLLAYGFCHKELPLKTSMGYGPCCAVCPPWILTSRLKLEPSHSWADGYHGCGPLFCDRSIFLTSLLGVHHYVCLPYSGLSSFNQTFLALDNGAWLFKNLRVQKVGAKCLVLELVKWFSKEAIKD